MKHQILSVVLAASVALGCATPSEREAEAPPAEAPDETPAVEPVQEPDPEQQPEDTGDPLAEQAARKAEQRELIRTLVETGTTATLTEAFTIGMGDEQADDPDVLQMLYVAGKILGLLYGEGEVPVSPPLPDESGGYRAWFQEVETAGISVVTAGTGENEDFLTLIAAPLLLLRGIPDASFQDSELAVLADLLRKADARNSSSVLPPYLLALVEIRTGKIQQAEESLTESLKRADSFYPGRIELAEVLQLSGRPAEAVSLIEEVHDVVPPTVRTLKLLAESSLAAGYIEQAGEAAARALLLVPQRRDLMLLRIRYLDAAGNVQQALRMLDLLLTEDPRNTKLILWKAGTIHQGLDEDQRALDLLLATADLFVDDPDFHEAKGTVLLDLGRTAEGLRELNRALELDPHRVTVLRLLLQDAVKMNRWVQSTIYLSQILEASASEEDILLAFTVYRNLGEHLEALKYIEQLYETGDRGQYTTMYAEQLLHVGDTQRCLEIVESGLSRIEAPETRSDLYLLKAMAIEGSGGGELLQYLRFSLLENPDNIASLQRISQAYIQMQEYRKAYQYLKRAHELDPDDYGIKLQFDQVRKYTESEE